MPNRIIKESICSDDRLDKISFFEESVFYRIIVNCDDYGRLDARPNFLKSKLYITRKGVTERNVYDAVLKLASVGLVRLYEVDEKPFLLLPKWEKHQSVRAKSSKYPAPKEEEESVQVFENICKQMIPDESKCFSNPIQSNTKTLGDFGKPKVAEIESFFESLWQQYPKKEGKGAVKEGQKRKLYAIGYEELSRAIARYKAKIQRDGIERRFVKQGSTFFNSGYVDFLDANYEPVKDSGVLGHAGLPLFEDINDDE